MDIEIIYENAERELYNAHLLKFELEKRGFSVKISPAFEPKIPTFNTPRLIITPWLYDDDIVDPIKFKYLKRVNKILNLQYEQVISKMWLEIGRHCPKGLAKNGIHICWGNKIKRRLMSVGVSEKNIKVINDMKFDYSNDIFKEYFKTKEELGKEFNINPQNQWNLFISSFSFVNPSKNLMERNIKEMGKDYALKFKENSEKSQVKIVNWIEKFISKNPSIEFIYRPHPGEITENDVSKFEKLSEKYPNFHFIFKYSVQDWIMSSDVINTWISTSIVDIYLLNKKCNILRPVKVDEYMDIPFYINSIHLSNYQEFEKNNLNIENDIFPVNEDEIKDYYNINPKLSYIQICDFIESIIDDDTYNQNYYYKSPIFDNLKFLWNKFKENRIFPMIGNLFKKNQSSTRKINNSIDEKKVEKLKNIVYNN